MVPIRSRLLDGKVVRKTRAWRNATLCDTNGAVHLISPVLEETMEVDASALVPELQCVSITDKSKIDMLSYLVVYIGNDSVTFRKVEQRKWPLSIDSHDGTLSHSIRVRSYPRYIPIKCDGCRARRSGEGRKTRQEALQRPDHDERTLRRSLQKQIQCCKGGRNGIVLQCCRREYRAKV